METIDYNGVTLHRWNCGPSTFLARPELGARFMNWNLKMSDGNVRDVIHWPENADFERFDKVRGGKEDINIRILQDTETASPANAMVIWTEFKDSPCYCVEPWMGPPNSAEHGKGLHTLEPGKRSSFTVEVSV